MGSGYGRNRVRLAAVLMVCLLFSTVFYGCGGGGGTAITPLVPNTASGGAQVAGRLIDIAGNPVSGAQITSIDGASVTTDSNGNFFLNATASETGTPVRFSAKKDGYIDGLYTVRVFTDYLSNGRQNTLLTIRKLPTSAADATHAQVTGADGSTQDIPPTAVSKGGTTFYQSSVTITGNERAVAFSTPADNGTLPDVSFQLGSSDGSGANAGTVLGQTGVVNCQISYGSPTDEDALKTFPGEFLTAIDTGSGEHEQALITAGFTRISLTDANGQPITKFAEGQTAKISMKVPSDSLNPETGDLINVGDTIPVFVFNEISGQWIVERNADNSIKQTTVQQDNSGNLFVEFETSHLSWFNLDYWGDICDPHPVVHIVDGSGNPLTGASLYMTSTGFDIDQWHGIYENLPDSGGTIYNVPAKMSWQIYAKKGDITSKTLTVQACHETTSGNSEFNIVIGDEPPAPVCSTNSECDDSISTTLDKCVNPGKSFAACTHSNCTVLCDSNTQCDDAKTTTSDVCVNANTCQSYCTHAGCSSACTLDSHCEDNNPDTLNVCMFAGTCNAVCQNPTAYCDLQLDRVNYIPGDTMTITLTARNEGSVPVSCGVGAALKNSPETQVWNSFNDSLFITIQPGQNVTRTITKMVPADWPGTDTAAGSDYDMFTLYEDGSRWDKGDNFNIHVSKTCTVACASDAVCSAPTPYCQNPGACDSICTSEAPCAIACSNDTQCDDGNPLTLDVCNSPGTCIASCSNTTCTPACSSDGGCDDSNALTFDLCVNPGTCSAACGHSVCTPICSSDVDCNDNNALTTDTCSAPATCDAACANIPFVPECSIDSECNDGNGLTTDFCVNPGLQNAACYNISLDTSVTPIAPVRINGTAITTVICNAIGTVNSLEGRCDSFSPWQELSSGNTMNCELTMVGSYSPGCRVNGIMTDDADTPVVVSNQAPVASIAATPTLGITAPMDVAFVGLCDDDNGACAAFSWDFGDGSVKSDEQNPSHSFLNPGVYIVSLTVTDNEYITLTKRLTITIGSGNYWITIPSGDFVMGCVAGQYSCHPQESPKHTVALSEYKIQQHEVTNAEYAQCVDAHVCSAPSSVNSNLHSPYYGSIDFDDFPVIFVNWSQANEFCSWIGARLPTEAEWEKAARGPFPLESYFPWGEDEPNCGLVNHYDTDGGSSSYCIGDMNRVGSYPTGSSYYGILDMSGNVWEWVNDWYDQNYYTTGGPPWINPQGPISGTNRVLKGGSAYSLDSSIRISLRYNTLPTISNNYIGFRCAKD